jgi:hypothetical protein
LPGTRLDVGAVAVAKGVTVAAGVAVAAGVPVVDELEVHPATRAAGTSKIKAISMRELTGFIIIIRLHYEQLVTKVYYYLKAGHSGHDGHDGQSGHSRPL